MPPANPPAWASVWHKQSFNKLNAIKLTRYEIVILLDNDVILWKNLDHLSGIQTPAAAWLTKTEFNSGVMVLSPSMGENLLRNYRGFTGKDEANGHQESWLNYYQHWNILPMGYNTHRGVCMNDTE